MAADPLDALINGQLYWFSDWPNRSVPTSGSAVYTVWNRTGGFIYVGMAGRSLTTTGKGPFGRLASHASGRRSGDQFCIYICDRLVLPRFHNRFSEIGTGQVSLDAATRDFIRDELGFRFCAVSSPADAFALERQLQRGDNPIGPPLLNPLSAAR